MLLYFLRHADAIYEGERPLSDKGRQQMKRVCRFLKEAGVQVDRLFTSPLLRAVETAEPAGEALGLEVEVTDLLDSGASLAELVELLEGCGPEDAVMLVGHEPDFSEMIAELTGGQLEVKKAAVALVACEEIAPDAGMLQWLVPPKLMG